MIKVLSLFSGCGGLDLGMRGEFSVFGEEYLSNDIEIVWANDIDKKACATFNLNFPDTAVICGNIVDLLNDDIQLPEADVVTGGFPCQDFSVAGKRQGFKVERGNLYLSMIETIKRVNPKIFIAENVKGLTNLLDGLALKTIVDDFNKLDYDIRYKLFNTADYGVPQTRERLLIVGVRKDLCIEWDWMSPTHNVWRSAYQAIGDLEDEKTLSSLPNSGYSKAKLSPGTQGNKPIYEDRPSPTIRAEHHGNIEFHYSLPRRLSAREAARLQSFPDGFEFLHSTSDAYRQIGNAVPPVFGWHIGKMIKQMIGK